MCIASGPLHAFLRKLNLLETIHANLITKEEFTPHAGHTGTWGKPVWEQMPTRPGAWPETTRSYLGRLVPVARAIRLNDCRTAIIARGLDYPAFDEVFAEASMTVVAAQNKRVALRAGPNRAVWRQLAAIATLRRAGEPGGPLALRHVLDAESFDLWTGALVANKTKLVDAVESVFALVPGALLRETGHRVYTQGVAHAEGLAAALRDPVWGVWFGRKCCLPAAPILAGGPRAHLTEAWQALLRAARLPEDAPLEAFTRVEEADSFGAGVDTLNDQPVTFSKPNTHAPRRIRVHHPLKPHAHL